MYYKDEENTHLWAEQMTKNNFIIYLKVNESNISLSTIAKIFNIRIEWMTTALWKNILQYQSVYTFFVISSVFDNNKKKPNQILLCPSNFWQNRPTAQCDFSTDCRFYVIFFSGACDSSPCCLIWSHFLFVNVRTLSKTMMQQVRPTQFSLNFREHRSVQSLCLQLNQWNSTPSL